MCSKLSRAPGEYGYCGNKTVNAEAEATFNFTENWGFCLESKVIK
jgi:hypothetical protein